MDYIYLEDCQFYGYHGAFEEEQTLGQIFKVNCRLGLDLSDASTSDQLEDTVHYGQVFEFIKHEVETKKYRLIEKLSGELIRLLFEKFPKVNEVSIKVSKINPPINGHYKEVAVSLTRSRR